jgi:hypothetical protein
MDPEELAQQADDELNTILVEEPVEPDTDEDDDDDAGQPEAPPENAKARKRQRGSNYRELTETTKRLEQQLQEERTARARMEGLMQASLQQPRQQQTGPHPIDQELDRVFEEQDSFYKLLTSRTDKLSPQEQTEATRRARELEIRKGELLAARANLRMGVGRAQSPQEVQQQAFQAQLQMRYPDIAAHAQASEYGGHLARAKIAAKGGVVTWDLLDEAAEETRKQFGMTSAHKPPPPTKETKAKYVGTSKGAGSNGNGENKPIRIDKKQAQMAENAYPHLPAGKAHQKWWNEVGKKHA